MDTDSLYYFSKADQSSVGPLTIAELQRAILSPDWFPDARIWRDGWAGWEPWDLAASKLGLRIPTPGSGTASDSSIEVNSIAPAAENFYLPPNAKLSSEPGDRSAPDELVFASFLSRFVAWFVDRVVVYVGFLGGSMLNSFFVSVAADAGAGPNPGLAVVSLGVMLTLIVAVVAYYVYFEQSVSGATLGKRLLGIRVVDLQGRRISLGRSMIRTLVSPFSGALFCIGFLMALVTAKRQALHDLAAGTLVIVASPDLAQRSSGGGARSGTGLKVVSAVIAGFFLFLGGLAAIAIPAYRDFVLRTHVAQAMNETAPIRDEIAAHYLANSEQCPENGSAAFGPASSYFGKHHSDVELASEQDINGRQWCITRITLANAKNDTVDGAVLTMTMSPGGVWSCATGTVPVRYVPRYCSPPE